MCIILNYNNGLGMLRVTGCGDMNNHLKRYGEVNGKCHSFHYIFLNFNNKVLS